MGKLLLNSIIVATLAIPMRAASDPSAVRGLRRAVFGVVAFNACYLVAILYVLPRLG